MLNESSIVVVFERPMDRDLIDHWQLSVVGNMAHVVVMPHLTINILDRFLNDLVRKREIWYEFGQIGVPCLAEDIGLLIVLAQFMELN